MVKPLSQSSRQALANALAETERNTSAELVSVIAGSSDYYYDFILLYSLMTGTLAAIALWLYRPIFPFPMLLATQLGVMVLCPLIPYLRTHLIRLIPKTIRHHRAAHRAYEEYLHISRHVSASVPILLFYVSLAERYVHILPSRQIREKIPNSEWENIVREFVASLPQAELEHASVQATQRIGKLLAAHFPATGKEQHFHHPVIEHP